MSDFQLVERERGEEAEYWRERASDLGLQWGNVRSSVLAYAVGAYEALRDYHALRQRASIVREMNADLEWLNKVIGVELAHGGCSGFEVRWRKFWNEPPSEDNPEYRLLGTGELHLDRSIHEEVKTATVLPGRLRWYVRGCGMHLHRVTTSEEGESDA